MKYIQDSKKILVCVPANLTADSYISAHIVASSLKKELNKEVEIASMNQIPQNFLSALPIQDIKLLNKLPPRKFVIELKNQKSKVKSIQWDQSEDKLNFFVTMENGNLNTEDFSAKLSGANYETIILVGVNNISELGEIYSESKEVFAAANILSIGGKVAIEGKQVDLQIDEKNTSVCEDTFLFMQRMGNKIDNQAASNLLCGIFELTDNFKKNIANPQTFIIAADLMKLGATNEEAQKLLQKFSNDLAQNPKPADPAANLEGQKAPSTQPFARPESNNAQQTNQQQ